MTLAILAGGNPLDVRTWSGTPHHMSSKLLSRFPDAFVITKPRPAWLVFLRRVLLKLSGRKIDLFWSVPLAAVNARSLVKVLRRHDVDMIFSIANSALSAQLARYFPTIHVSDATVPLMQEYYEEFRRLPRSLLASAHCLDRMSAAASLACIYSTSWAANSAHADYGIDCSKIHVVPWGCNVASASSLEPPEWRRETTLHLVFIGVDWVRKGGALAVETTKRLAARKVDVKLHIIGGSPEIDPDPSIIIHGFLDKNTEEGRTTLVSVLNQGCFLLLPTRQDCSPMVFAEANAFGMPVITSDTGGVSDVVIDGESGHVLPLDAGPDEYADLIAAIWSDPERYAKLRLSSWLRFKTVLNWDTWLDRIAGIITTAGRHDERRSTPPA